MKKLFGVLFAIVLLSATIFSNTVNLNLISEVSEIETYKAQPIDTRYNYSPGEFERFASDQTQKR